jgi:hypothetical protein
VVAANSRPAAPAAAPVRLVSLPFPAAMAPAMEGDAMGAGSPCMGDAGANAWPAAVKWPSLTWPWLSAADVDAGSGAGGAVGVLRAHVSSPASTTVLMAAAARCATPVAESAM